MENNPLYSNVFAAVRLPMAILIVLLHNNPLLLEFEISSSIYWQQFPLYIILHHIFTNGIARIAVPCFFFCSGFLFYNKYNADASLFTYCKGKIFKSLQSILLPYIIWNIIFILVKFSTQLCTSHDLIASKSFIDYTVFDWIGILWNPVAGQLWFLRDIFVIGLFGFPIYYLLKNRVTGFIIIMILIFNWLFGCTFIPDFVSYFVFWSLGAYFNVHHIDFLHRCDKTKHICLLLFALSLGIDIHLNLSNNPFANYMQNFVVFVGVFAVLTSMGAYLQINHLQVSPKDMLSSASFFIYSAHPLLLMPAYKLWIKVVPLNTGYLILEYFSVTLLVVLSLLFIMKEMGKYFPKILTVLNGGRV